MDFIFASSSLRSHHLWEVELLRTLVRGVWNDNTVITLGGYKKINISDPDQQLLCFQIVHWLLLNSTLCFYVFSKHKLLKNCFKFTTPYFFVLPPFILRCLLKIHWTPMEPTPAPSPIQAFWEPIHRLVVHSQVLQQNPISQWVLLDLSLSGKWGIEQRYLAGHVHDRRHRITSTGDAVHSHRAPPGGFDWFHLSSWSCCWDSVADGLGTDGAILNQSALQIMLP